MHLHLHSYIYINNHEFRIQNKRTLHLKQGIRCQKQAMFVFRMVKFAERLQRLPAILLDSPNAIRVCDFDGWRDNLLRPIDGILL